MTTFVAFLRAINVGGHTVTMDRLRELFAEIDLPEAETFIASGNVIFSSRARNAEALERRIATHLHDSLGYEVATFVRTLPALSEVLGRVPFQPRAVESSHALMIGFLAAAPDAETAGRVAALSGPVDRLVVEGRELYWLRLARDSDPKLAKPVERALGMAMTARNANTVRRLLDRYGDRPVGP